MTTQKNNVNPFTPTASATLTSSCSQQKSSHTTSIEQDGKEEQFHEKAALRNALKTHLPLQTHQQHRDPSL